MKNIRSRFLLVVSLILLAGKISLTAATETNSWLLTSPDGQCAKTVCWRHEILPLGGFILRLAN